eukprot:scaffold2988_cov123-Isochrysis_galbana.AAC.2
MSTRSRRAARPPAEASQGTAAGKPRAPRVHKTGCAARKHRPGPTARRRRRGVRRRPPVRARPPAEPPQARCPASDQTPAGGVSAPPQPAARSPHGRPSGRRPARRRPSRGPRRPPRRRQPRRRRPTRLPPCRPPVPRPPATRLLLRRPVGFGREWRLAAEASRAAPTARRSPTATEATGTARTTADAMAAPGVAAARLPGAPSQGGPPPHPAASRRGTARTCECARPRQARRQAGHPTAVPAARGARHLSHAAARLLGHLPLPSAARSRRRPPAASQSAGGWPPDAPWPAASVGALPTAWVSRPRLLRCRAPEAEPRSAVVPLERRRPNGTPRAPVPTGPRQQIEHGRERRGGRGRGGGQRLRGAEYVSEDAGAARHPQPRGARVCIVWPRGARLAVRTAGAGLFGSGLIPAGDAQPLRLAAQPATGGRRPRTSLALRTPSIAAPHPRGPPPERQRHQPHRRRQHPLRHAPRACGRRGHDHVRQAVQRRTASLVRKPRQGRAGHHGLRWGGVGRGKLRCALVRARHLVAGAEHVQRVVQPPGLPAERVLALGHATRPNVVRHLVQRWQKRVFLEQTARDATADLRVRRGVRHGQPVHQLPAGGGGSRLSNHRPLGQHVHQQGEHFLRQRRLLDCGLAGGFRHRAAGRRLGQEAAPEGLDSELVAGGVDEGGCAKPDHPELKQHHVWARKGVGKHR